MPRKSDLARLTRKATQMRKLRARKREEKERLAVEILSQSQSCVFDEVKPCVQSVGKLSTLTKGYPCIPAEDNLSELAECSFGSQSDTECNTEIKCEMQCDDQSEYQINFPIPFKKRRINNDQCHNNILIENHDLPYKHKTEMMAAELNPALTKIKQEDKSEMSTDMPLFTVVNYKSFPYLPIINQSFRSNKEC